jgi:hypothetical protein
MKFSCLTFILASVVATGLAGETIQRAPLYRGITDVVRSEAQPEGSRYLAFPSVLEVSPGVLWVAYKAGASHATDAGAGIEIVRHDLATGRTELLQRLNPESPKLFQMGELARLPDGTIGLYLDVHHVGDDNRHYRTGAESYRWDEGKKSFIGPERMAPIGGVTYGYPLDFTTKGDTTWQLIMSFGYLAGGRWSVDVVRSKDAGKSWQFIRNLSQEFGDLRINESAVVPHGDGFIVTTRGYDGHERLHRVDGQFKVQQQVDLTERYDFINRYIGRPRLFMRDGKGYIIGRNWTRPLDAPAERGGTPGAMKLSLFRFDPKTLAVEAHTVLDNVEEANVTDGYYAVPVFSERNGETILHAITYKAFNKQPPDIVRLDYRWEEVK